MKKKRILRWLSVIGVFATLAILWLINVDWRAVADWHEAQTFRPSDEISTISRQLGLTDKGQTIFYATHPELKSNVTFNATCGYDGAKTFTLGCYYRNDENKERINIYNSGVQSFVENGLEYDFAAGRRITALHEMLHAVWDRLGDEKKTTTCNYLRDITASIPDLDNQLKLYPSSQFCTEAFARFGSEYAVSFNMNMDYTKDLKMPVRASWAADYLANLYSEYFSCTNTYTAHAYWKNKNQLDNYANRIEVGKKYLDSERSIIQSLVNNYYRYPTRAKYNSVNARITKYNTEVNNHNSRIKTYNKVIATLDSEQTLATANFGL